MFKKLNEHTQRKEKIHYTGVTEFWTRLHSLSVNVRFVSVTEDKGVIYLKRIITNA